MTYLIDANHPGIIFACGTPALAEEFFAAMQEEGSAMHYISEKENFPSWDVCHVQEDFDPERFNPFYYWWYTV